MIVSKSGEIVRFVSKLFWYIPGAFSRLLSRIPKPLYSYVDQRLFTGKSYKACGFSYASTSQPNYFYCHKNTRKPESRIKYQKHKLHKILTSFDSTKSEIQNMTTNGFLEYLIVGILNMN